MKCKNCEHYNICVVCNYIHDKCGYYEPTRPHGECGTCKHFVKGGLDGKTYVCEHPSIEQDDYFNYAFLSMDEKDFCSCYENYEKKEGEQK